jgi:hypothetical protein
LIARVEAGGGRAIGVEADVSQAADLHRIIEAAVDTYRRDPRGVSDACLGGDVGLCVWVTR